MGKRREEAAGVFAVELAAVAVAALKLAAAVCRGAGGLRRLSPLFAVRSLASPTGAPFRFFFHRVGRGLRIQVEKAATPR